MKKDSLLDQSGLNAIYYDASAHTNPPEDVAETYEDDVPEPQSLKLMCRILAELFEAHSGIGYDAYEIVVEVIDDESSFLALDPIFANKPTPAEIEIFDQSASSFLADLRVFANPRFVRVSPACRSIDIDSKLSLLNTIKDYCEENGLNSVDTIFFPELRERSKVSHKRIDSKLNELAQSVLSAIGNNEDAGHQLLTGAASTPYFSHTHLVAMFSRVMQAEVSVSFDHIYKTILQEDRLEPVDPRADLMKFGGYN